MLLSDRDLRAAIDAGRLGVDPFDGVMVQPSSIDVRLDRYFRVFENHRYPHIDPAEEQPDLTRLVEPSQDEPFILHPGEFVLGSTYEVVSLADDLAARLEGKALDLDTPIPTQHGFLLMSEVAPGDVVFDESGAPARVVDVSPVLYGRPCYRVEFSDGAVLIADEAHQWVTRTKHERSKGLPAAVRTTRELAESVRCRAEWNHHVALPGPVEYPARDLPVDPYVLGVWLGDGTSTGAVVTCNDAQVLAEIRTAGYAVDRASGPIAWRIGGTGHTRDAATGRYTRNGSFSSSLRNLRLLGDKHVPEPYFVASIDQRLALIQGLMDSDGYCDEFGRCEYVSTREVLADAVVELAASLGLRPKKRKKRAMLHGIDCGPAYQVKFVPHIPVFRLERKLRRQKPPTARLHRHRAIVAVTPVGSRPVRCIEVDSPSGMYLAGTQYVPTHNSSLGRLGLLTHSTAGFIDPGFNGHVTLELSNVATLPIKLWPGMKIGQLAVFRLSSAAEFPYGSKQYGSRYQGQRGPTPSRSYLNFSRTEV